MSWGCSAAEAGPQVICSQRIGLCVCHSRFFIEVAPPRGYPCGHDSLPGSWLGLESIAASQLVTSVRPHCVWMHALSEWLSQDLDKEIPLRNMPIAYQMKTGSSALLEPSQGMCPQVCPSPIDIAERR